MSEFLFQIYIFINMSRSDWYFKFRFFYICFLFSFSLPPLPPSTLSQGESLQGGDDSPFSDSVTLEQTTSNIGISSGRVSLWMQWMLPKLTVKLFAPDPENTGTGITFNFKKQMHHGTEFVLHICSNTLS